MFFGGARRFGVLSASAHGRLVLLVGAVALGCAAGGAAAQSRPSGAAAAHLYWANFTNGTIVEANLNGTHAKTIAKGQHYPMGAAVGGSHLYWANGGTHPFVNGNDRRSQPERHPRQDDRQGPARPGRGSGRRQPPLLGHRRHHSHRWQQRHDRRGQPERHPRQDDRQGPEPRDRGRGRRQPPLLGQLPRRHDRRGQHERHPRQDDR